MRAPGDPSIRFSRAIVRPPGPTFAAGLTTASLGSPDPVRALEQHGRYVEALEACGLRVIRVEGDARFPDGTFVEDTAVLAPGLAVVARPGAESRRGETALMRTVLEGLFPRVREIVYPGTLDGGDVCRAGDRFFIGVSDRTNRAGARQLAAFLEKEGFSAALVAIGAAAPLLHLKSGMAYLGEGRILLVGALESNLDGSVRAALRGYEIIRVPPEETYAANCVRVNDRVLLAAGHPRVREAVEGAGLRAIALEMSEFRKMDGGLSCLSLRF